MSSRHDDAGSNPPSTAVSSFLNNASSTTSDSIPDIAIHHRYEFVETVYPEQPNPDDTAETEEDYINEERLAEINDMIAKEF